MSAKLKIVMLTSGSGETSQAVAFAQYALDKGAQIFLCYQFKDNLDLLKTVSKSKNFQAQYVGTKEEFYKILQEQKPQTLILVNSKMFCPDEDFANYAPANKPLTLSIDSNWMFDWSKMTYVKWVDQYLVNFPQEIFDAGLTKNSGHYQIPQDVFKKIKPVGLIPSYKKPTPKELAKTRAKYCQTKQEKLVFTYCGFGVNNAPYGIVKILPAVKALNDNKNANIRLIYVGDRENIKGFEKENWLVHKPSLAANEFYETLAAADLICQHRGMGTMAQVISAQIPVLATVKDPSTPSKNPGAWEMAPFQKAGACEMLFASDPTEKSRDTIEKLLFDKASIKKMKAIQKKLYIPGEKQVYKIITDYIKK